MYAPLRLSDYGGGRRGGTDEFGDVVLFRHCWDGTTGIPLSVVLRQDWDTVAKEFLANCDSPALPDNIAAKISLRIEVGICRSFV